MPIPPTRFFTTNIDDADLEVPDTCVRNYPCESEGLCFYRRWFVCLSVCLFVCLFVTTITK